VGFFILLVIFPATLPLKAPLSKALFVRRALWNAAVYVLWVLPNRLPLEPGGFAFCPLAVCGITVVG